MRIAKALTTMQMRKPIRTFVVRICHKGPILAARNKLWLCFVFVFFVFLRLATADHFLSLVFAPSYLAHEADIHYIVRKGDNSEYADQTAHRQGICCWFI